jgi:hypothetical protein
MTQSRAWFEGRIRELAALLRRLPASRQRAFARHLDDAEAVEAAAAEVEDTERPQPPPDTSSGAPARGRQDREDR